MKNDKNNLTALDQVLSSLLGEDYNMNDFGLALIEKYNQQPTLYLNSQTEYKKMILQNTFMFDLDLDSIHQKYFSTVLNCYVVIRKIENGGN